MKQPTKETIELGNRIRKARIKKGYISQEKFGLDNDISRVLLSNWENGNGNITFRNLIKLTKALNISLEELFKDFEKSISDNSGSK